MGPNAKESVVHELLRANEPFHQQTQCVITAMVDSPHFGPCLDQGQITTTTKRKSPTPASANLLTFASIKLCINHLVALNALIWHRCGHVFAMLPYLTNAYAVFFWHIIDSRIIHPKDVVAANPRWWMPLNGPEWKGKCGPGTLACRCTIKLADTMPRYIQGVTHPIFQ